MNIDSRELAAQFDLEKLTPEFYADPYPTYRALREHEPVKRLRSGSYFLTRYDDLVEIYRDAKTWGSDKTVQFKPKFGASSLYEHHTTSLVFNDPPIHTRVRKLLAPGINAMVSAKISISPARVVSANRSSSVRPGSVPTQPSAAIGAAACNGQPISS